MNVPQTGRQPVSLTDEQVRDLLRKRRPLDKLDPFATDPNQEISKLGRLALRREEPNDLFVLGDLCARQSLANNDRLLVYYVGKALLAYNRAIEKADNPVDQKLARRAIEQYLNWVIDTANQHPTRRNLAVALWAASDDDTPVDLDTTLQDLLDLYRQQVQPKDFDPLETQPAFAVELDEEDGTVADLQAATPLSDASMTLAEGSLPDDAFSRVGEAQAAPSETHVEDNLPEDTQFDSFHSRYVASRPRQESEFAVGDHIEDRFEVADVLWGGMGVVYLCYDHHQREPVAIKTFQERFLENERAVARFTHEALTWIRLEKHRHIVQARLVQNINNRPHIILEHVSGPEQMGADLRSWIDHRRLDLGKSLEFALHIALGMRHATQKVPGMVHRDLKPANILVSHEDIAKVTDFGLVRSVDVDDKLMTHENEDDMRLTRVGAIVGTAPYMSPEQCQSQDVDIRSDIYAFGCVLYEMLTGNRVFQASKFPEWMTAHINEQPVFPAEPIIPADIQTFVQQCLAKTPDQRPNDWNSIVDTLTAFFRTHIGEEPVLEITGPALEARELMDKGYSLTALGRHNEALEAYDRAIVLQPDYAWAWARKGRTMRLLERYDDALACYERALEIQPHYAWAWNGKGIVLERLNRLEDALACFETATEMNPHNVWNWYNRADALQNLGCYEDALPLLQRGLEIDPVHPNSWAKLGQVYRLLGRFEKAVNAYQKAIELEPTYAWAHNGCGLALKVLGRTEEALLCFKRASRYHSGEVWHWYNLTEMLVEMGRYEDAVQPAQQATRTDPTHAFSWAKLGQVMRYLGRHSEALQAYERAIELTPDSSWSINGRGIVLEQMERYEEALLCYQQAADLKPDDVWHWYNQGNVLILMGRYSEALEPLERATQIMPGHARSWARLGNALRHLGRYEGSLEACIQATFVSPNYAWAWNEQGITLEVMERYDEALLSYQHASELAPDEPYYLYKQTDVLVLMGRNEEALNLLDVALRLENRNPQIWAQHGQILRRLGRLDEALSSYNQAVELE